MHNGSRADAAATPEDTAGPGRMTLRPCLICGALSHGSRCPTHQLNRNGSTRQWRRLREQILARDRHVCRACGAPAQHVDHRQPVARGGTDNPSNLTAMCARCNLAKGDRAA